MKILIFSLWGAFRDMLKPRILAFMILPFLISFTAWSLITWAAWDWIVGLGFKLYGWAIMQRMIDLLSPYFVMTSDPLIWVTVAAFIVMVIVPLAFITAIIITSIILVPMLVGELRRKEFAHVPKVSNSIYAGSGATIGYSIKYFISWLVLIPLWFVLPGGALAVPFILLAWFNSRMFTWEVMTEIAEPAQTSAFLKQNSKTLFWLGILTTPLYYVPVLNFVAPVIVSAAFARFCLTKFSAQKI